MATVSARIPGTLFLHEHFLTEAKIHSLGEVSTSHINYTRSEKLWGQDITRKLHGWIDKASENLHTNNRSFTLYTKMDA